MWRAGSSCILQEDWRRAVRHPLWHTIFFLISGCVCWHGRIRLATLTKRAIRYHSHCLPSEQAAGLAWGFIRASRDKIPVVKQDFIFSAIAEELGGIFALCLILVCFSCFLMFMNIAMQMKDQFYKLVALGLGTVYATQVFLTIGGATKFIPSTGVTLPLVSYGGSSLLCSMIIFAIIQGLYILRQDEGEQNEPKVRNYRKTGRKKTGFEKADIEDIS